MQGASIENKGGGRESLLYTGFGKASQKRPYLRHKECKDADMQKWEKASGFRQ